LLAVKL